ncbi:MAG: ParB/RepB/Spo0J family partition protein [Lachnospiraceae bacterium]|nr:ParB/RepB/Spo0J family partition protein [Lachnospiraceae bacterium]
MAKAAMNDLLRKRMTASQQASELQTNNEVYEKIFREAPPPGCVQICTLPLDKLVPFFTADIGFRPYTPEQLNAFAEQLKEEGLLVRIIVRPMPSGDGYEILAGHNRTSAAKLAGWDVIPAEIVEADDARAIVIATSTNLIQRQNLSIVERGKAYRALLDAKNRQGYRIDVVKGTSGDSRQKSPTNHTAATSGENRQKYSARALVAEFFGVTEYEIRKAVKLTQLIPPLLDILETTPKRLNLACADLMADYAPESQEAFIEMCSIEGYQINKATMQHIVRKCPPPIADRQSLYAAWREAQDKAIERMTAPPKKITFNRKAFAPYLDDLGSDQDIEALFLEFLQERRNRRIMDESKRNEVDV